MVAHHCTCVHRRSSTPRCPCCATWCACVWSSSRTGTPRRPPTTMRPPLTPSKQEAMQALFQGRKQLAPSAVRAT